MSRSERQTNSDLLEPGAGSGGLPFKPGHLLNSVRAMLLGFYQVTLFVLDLVYFLWRAAVVIVVSCFRVVVPPNRKSVQGDIVLVTGAGHGLGRELAYQLAKEGAKLALWDIHEETCRATALEIRKMGKIAYAYRCDVSNREEVGKVAQRVRQDLGQVTMLINNAGILPCKPMLMLNPQQIQRCMDVNTLSHFWTIREFLPMMLEMDRGHVVCISSMAGLHGFPHLAAYGASKYAVAGLMEALKEEMRYYQHHNIQFTTVHPVIIDTGMAKKTRNKYPWISPILPTHEAAEIIVDGVLRNYRQILIPKIVFYFHKIAMALPGRVFEEFAEFLGYGVEPFEETD